MAAFDLIGNALDLGGMVTGQLNQLPVVGQVMGDLSGVSDFLTYTGAAAQQMGNAMDTLQSGINSGSIGAWLDNGSTLIEQVSDSMTNAAKGAQRLTGWLATRSDGVASTTGGNP